MLRFTFNEAKPGSRVGEWAPNSYNIGTGCLNNCKYCYARDIALKNGSISEKSKWTEEKVNLTKANIHDKADGLVMFPSMHDITDAYLPTYIAALENILKAGNSVLIVSKPRKSCITEICNRFEGYRDKILFRFTIGSLSEGVCKFWEPNAPSPQERIESLRYAFDQGFQTSVSVEPMLEECQQAVDLYNALEPFITETIWFGKMQEIEDRVDMSDPVNKKAAKFIQDFQSDQNIRQLYDSLKDNPKVRWKDSIREVIGI